MTTVKQIHESFRKDVSEFISGSNYEALQKTGFNLVPPKEQSKAFPFNKLIHINRIFHLCEKYNLIFAPTSQYIGTIPAKNILELEQFTNEYNYIHVRQNKLNFWGNGSETDHLFVKDSDKASYKNAEYWPVFDWMIVASREQLAPDEETAHTLGRIRTVQDPIIIAMIRSKYWAKYPHRAEWGVVVTAWGEEANDDSIVNEKMN